MLIQAARDALGGEGVAMLAGALNCSEARFKYVKPRVLVVAVLELVQCANENSLPRATWPARWHCGCELSSSDSQRLRKRFEDIFGSEALIPRLAAALEMSCAGLRRSLCGDRRRASQDLQTLVELLEFLECSGVMRSSWPARWQMTKRQRHKKPQRQKHALPDPACLAARVDALFSSRFPSAAFARAIGRTPDSLSRVWRRERDSHGRIAVVQTEIVALVELLEALKNANVSIEYWPERWRATIQL